MANKNTAVFGIYATPATAENGVDHLLVVGFTNSAISVLLPDDESTRAFAHEKSTKAPEGTATGVATGGVIEAQLGLLAGIGALAIPGVGPLIAAGPIMGALAGLKCSQPRGSSGLRRRVGIHHRNGVAPGKPADAGDPHSGHAARHLHRSRRGEQQFVIFSTMEGEFDGPLRNSRRGRRQRVDRQRVERDLSANA